MPNDIHFKASGLTVTLSAPQPSEPVDRLNHWQDLYDSGAITLEELAHVASLMIFRDRISLADETLRWLVILFAMAVMVAMWRMS